MNREISNIDMNEFNNYSDEHMRISDVIKFLEEIKDKSGDIEVRYWEEDRFHPENSRMRWLTEFQLKAMHILYKVTYSSRMGKKTLEFLH